MADNISNHPCAIILTAIRDEYMAVRAHLSQLQEDTHPRGSIYECGIFTAEKWTWKVVIMEIGAGNIPPAVEAERAIERFEPELMFFVGVAGGLKDVALGDVVVATKVYGYESGKAGKNFLPRPGVGLTSYSLESRARAEGWKRDWLQRLGGSIQDPPPNVFIAPIAAGEKVVSSTRSAIYKFIRATYNDALAIEMEGYGFLQATRASEQVHAIVIRGISDLIDDKEEADAANTQAIAARHASAFAFQILAKYKPGSSQEKTFEDSTRSQRNFKDFKDKVEGKWKNPTDDRSENSASNDKSKDSDEYTRKNERISEKLKKDWQSVTFFTESESKVDSIQLPNTEEEFAEWYYEKLGDYEQYYVLTTAVLHGAPVREIVTRTDHLYQFVHNEVERRGNLARFTSHNEDQPQGEHRDPVRFSDPMLRMMPGKKLQKLTYTKTRKKDGVECLYWQDADQYGLSTFGLKLLEFLCKEYIGKGELGQFFLNALQRWSEEGIGEISRRANQSKKDSDKEDFNEGDFDEENIDEVTRKVIHSYGVVLWSHDAKKLRRTAKSWALQNKPISAAELLDGAYEIYRVKSEDSNVVGASPVVLPLLKKWIRHIHKVLDEFEFEESKPKDNLTGASSKEASKVERGEEKQVDKNEAFQKKDDKSTDGKESDSNKKDQPTDEKGTDKKEGENLADTRGTGKMEGEKQAENQDDDDEFSKAESTPKVAIRLGCAVASTYALIGKRSPDIALNGQEELLKLPLNNNAAKFKDTSRVFAYGLSTYVMLTRSGHIRDVLEHLATSAEQLTHSPRLPRESKKRYEYRRKRIVYLEVVLEAFFLVAARSTTDLQDIEDARYSLNEPLLIQPPIPDSANRDVLLAFLLSRSETRCQEFITILLCSAIIERQSRYAFGLLRYWAEIVLQLLKLDIPNAEEMHSIFLQYIVYLGRTVERWCFDLEQQKLYPSPAFETFKKRLKQWCTEGAFYSHPIGNFAEAVLQQLGES